MLYFLSSCIFYIQVILGSSEDLDYLWSVDGEISGPENPLSLSGDDISLFSDFNPLGDHTWDLNEATASEISFPLQDTQFLYFTSAPASSFDNEDYAFTLENPSSDDLDDVDDLDDLDDPLIPDNGCLDPSKMPMGRLQPRSTGPGLNVCALRKEGSSPLNVPDTVRLEDVQRVPGFVPLFRGMSDSCIVYSEGILPFGVCSSTQPEDSLYSHETFFGLLTWLLYYCTLGKSFPCSFLEFRHSFVLAGWLAGRLARA